MGVVRLRELWVVVAYIMRNWCVQDNKGGRPRTEDPRVHESPDEEAAAARRSTGGPPKPDDELPWITSPPSSSFIGDSESCDAEERGMALSGRLELYMYIIIVR